LTLTGYRRQCLCEGVHREGVHCGNGGRCRGEDEARGGRGAVKESTKEVDSERNITRDRIDFE
jgi:hypothetical protein